VTPKHWSVNALSAELGIDRRSLARRLEGLTPASEKKVGKRTERGYLLRDVFHHLQTDGAERLDLNAERAKLAVLQQEKIRMEIAEKRGKLLSVEGVTAHWQSIVTEIRGALLAMPNRAAPMLARRDEAYVSTVLTDLIYQALHAFSRSAIPPDLRDRIARYEQEAGR
jgi:phage terminase Nu1 subunit (DNA packaging protein)